MPERACRACGNPVGFPMEEPRERNATDACGLARTGGICPACVRPFLHGEPVQSVEVPREFNRPGVSAFIHISCYRQHLVWCQPHNNVPAVPYTYAGTTRNLEAVFREARDRAREAGLDEDGLPAIPVRKKRLVEELFDRQ